MNEKDFETKTNKTKIFETWKDNFVNKSGLSFYGQDVEGSFERKTSRYSSDTKGAFNADVAWLRESIASGTDEEINNYIKRLQDEGYSKKDLLQIKDHLLEERSSAKSKVVQEYITKTQGGKTIKTFEHEGVQYGILGAGNLKGNKASMLGVNLETGERLDIGSFLFGDEKLTTNEAFDNAYDHFINTNWKDDISEEEMRDRVTKALSSKNDSKTSSTKKTYTTSKDIKKKNKQKKQSKNQGKKQVAKKKPKATGNIEKDIANAVINEVVNETIETAVETATDTVDEAVEKIVEPVSRFGKTNNYGISHEQVAQYAKDNFLSIDEAYERLDKLNEIESNVDGKILPTDYGKNRTGYTINQLGGQDADGNFTYFDEKGNLVKSGMLDSNVVNDDGSVITKVKKDTRPDGNIRKDDIKKPSKFWNQADDTIFSKGMRGFNVAANVIGTISTYKNARRQGHGVISSAARAGVDFAVGEALGMWAIPLELVKNVPTAAIKGTEALYKENRRMNAAANNQAFSNAQFADTQQLATMRASGMELAKMSQYNLQQTLMGNEAQFMHK